MVSLLALIHLAAMDLSQFTKQSASIILKKIYQFDLVPFYFLL